jgi:CRP/FNR family cyclic AMP-dependent transcriptional regulator
MPLTTLTPKIKNLEKLIPHCHSRRYAAKSTILCPGDHSETMYLILKGSITVLIDDDSGRELIITYLKPGDFFGEMGLFDRGNSKQTRSTWVIAKTECQVAELSYDRFRELANQDPEILFTVIRQMAERLHNTTRKAFDLTFLDITHRVARTLLDLCKQPGAMTHPEGIQVKITRQEIARIISCSREMVGRVLKSLESQEFVQVRGKTMVVLAPPQPDYANKYTERTG